MNESETRAEYIDPKLKARGWDEVGSQQELLKHGGLYKKLWELQVGGFIA